MPPSLRRALIETSDALRYNPGLRHCLSRVLACAARVHPSTSPQRIARLIHRLTRAARLCSEGDLRLRIEAKIRDCIEALASRPVDWGEFEPHWTRSRLEKAVLLKPFISEREKGVLFVSFASQWLRLLRIPNLDEFARRFTLVLAPSWSPPHGLATCLFPVYYRGPVVSLISNADDLRILPRIWPGVTVVPLYASNWVNPDLYRPVPFHQKDIDILVVSNFAAFKRHFALFRALRRMPRSLRVTLVGQPIGTRAASVIMEEAGVYGVQDRLEVLESLSHAEVCDAFCRARISLILSRLEGSCVAVVESMMAGTPVGMLDNARVGSRVFVGPQTGRLLREPDLPVQLEDFLAEAGGYEPRRWALENRICCHGSTARLNATLREQALAAGEEWTVDILPHCWKPDPAHVSSEDRARLDPAYRNIRARFGLQIGQDGTS